jgi:DNA-binding transcriptional LysR family regulator
MKSVLDSRQLLAARVLADTGSFTLAGQHLSLTQSAVSHAIKALEEEVECTLFLRTGKGVKVTPAGRQFLQHADKILLQMETARTLVAPRLGKGKERLRIGVSAWSNQHVMPLVVPMFKKEFLNKHIAIEAGDSLRNLELLDAGLLDLAFTVRPPHRPGLDFMPLFDDELHFIVAPHHPWARRGRAMIADLAGSMLLLCAGSYNTPVRLAEHFRSDRISLRHAVEMDDHDAIKAVVRTGQAVGVLSPAFAKEEVDRGSLVPLPLEPRPLMLQWGVVYSNQRPLSAMERRLIELYREVVPKVRSHGKSHALPAYEKKDEPAVPAHVTERASYSGVALAVAGAAYNFLNDSMAWVNFGLMASAVS